MKNHYILHIDTEDTWRGGERQVVELINGLNRLNQKNLLICRPESAIGHVAAENNIDVRTFSLAGEWDISSSRKIRAIIKQEKIDIVHTHTSHAHTIGLLATIGMKHTKLVVSRRVDFHIGNIFSRKLKYGSGVDQIITVSDAIKRILVEDGVNPDIITTVRSGFIVKQFDNAPLRNLRAELGISTDTIVIATVAALAPHKDHIMLLKAAHNVIHKNDNVCFLLAGEGNQKDGILQTIHDLKLDSHVKLLDFVEDVQSVFNAADIFALSSREEGLCTSLLDAMYFSLPVVATNAGGIPELIQDQVNGLIVPVGDYVTFAEKLNFLIENASRREKMGIRSNSILAQHNMENTINNTLSVYHSLWQ